MDGDRDVGDAPGGTPDGATASDAPPLGLGERIRRRFAGIGFDGELERFPEQPPRPALFDDEDDAKA